MLSDINLIQTFSTDRSLPTRTDTSSRNSLQYTLQPISKESLQPAMWQTRNTDKRSLLQQADVWQLSKHNTIFKSKNNSQKKQIQTLLILNF